MSKVIQMIPAPGWTAAFRDEETRTKGDTRPLVCWAVMEDGAVEGMVVVEGEVKSVGGLKNFMSYHCVTSHAM